MIGLEVSGLIESVGDGVTGARVGDKCVAILAGGGYAEFVNVPAGQVIAPPDGLDLVSAAGLIEVAATVVSNFDHVHLGSGETVLIHGGAGGIGTFAIHPPKPRRHGHRHRGRPANSASAALWRDVALGYRRLGGGVARPSGSSVDVILRHRGRTEVTSPPSVWTAQVVIDQGGQGAPSTSTVCSPSGPGRHDQPAWPSTEQRRRSAPRRNASGH